MSSLDFYDPNNETIHFYPLEDKLSLPFPLYYPYGWSVFISAILFLTLVFGLKLRAIIFAYLLSPESKLGPINTLIWMDQINGLFLAGGIILRMLAINSPVPLSQLFGAEFCKWIGTPSCIYLCGAVAWSCFIALYRVFYIRLQYCFEERIGEQTLLKILLISGIVLTYSFGLGLVIFDDKKSSDKLCLHYSNEDLEILNQYLAIANKGDIVMNLKTPMMMMSSAMGGGFVVVEVICYISLYIYIYEHDKNMEILNPTNIRSRHRTNAISLSGQVLGWFMEMWYIIFAGFMATLFDFQEMREIAPFLKQLEFFLIPLVQVCTSAPIRKFLAALK